MLSESLMQFLREAASGARVSLPDRDSSLFLSGVLDSFSLVDFVTVIEAEYGIKVDDPDLRPENFDSIARVEQFIDQSMKKAADGARL
ncbi:MAG: acyl carrier protein [Blastocatellia bacterium]